MESNHGFLAKYEMLKPNTGLVHSIHGFTCRAALNYESTSRFNSLTEGLINTHPSC